jgi:2-iminobutanoate/2-iminopropanoate deaminase
MEKTVISTPNAPAAIGPYNQAIKTSGPFVFTSGQIPLQPQTGAIVGSTIQDQTHQVCQNIRAILQEAGSDLNKVIKTTVYLHDIHDFVAMNEIYALYFKENPPARSAFGGNDLPKGVKLMMECVAIG